MQHDTDRRNQIETRRRLHKRRMTNLKVFLPFSLVLFTLLFGIMGFSRYFEDNKVQGVSNCSVLEAFWLATGLPLGETTNNPAPGENVNILLHLGRITGYAVLLYAFIILVFSSIRPMWLRICARFYARFSSNRYAVICGLGWRGQEIAIDLLNNGYRVSILENDPANPFVKDIVGPRVIVFEEDATSDTALRAAQIDRAALVFVTAGGDHGGAIADELSCRTVRQIMRLIKPKDKEPCRKLIEGKKGEIELPKDCAGCDQKKSSSTKSIRIFMHADDLSVRDFLENSTHEAAADVQCFNTYEATARKLITRHPLFLPEERGGSRHVHLVVFGDSAMAKGLTLQLLRMMHIGSGRQVKLSLLVPDVKAAQGYWYDRFTCLNPERWKDNQRLRNVAEPLFDGLSFHKLPKAPELLLGQDFILYNHMNDPEWSTKAFFCIDDGIQSFALLHICSKGFETIPGSDQRTQFYHYYNYPEGEMYEEGTNSASNEKLKLEPILDGKLQAMKYVRFGSFLETCSFESLLDERSTRYAQEVFAAFEKSYDETVKYLIMLNCPSKLDELITWQETGTFQNDTHQLDAEQSACLIQTLWRHLPEWERNSNLQAADHGWIKLQEMGVNIETWRTGSGMECLKPDLVGEIVSLLKSDQLRVRLAEMEHRRWCAERLLHGWQPIPTDVTDDEKKKALKRRQYHAALVPFDALPGNEQRKDDILVLGLPVFMKNAGYFRP